MGQVLAEHYVQVAVTEDQGPVRQFSAQGPDDALADGIIMIAVLATAPSPAPAPPGGC
jgi:hypothetical protein